MFCQLRSWTVMLLLLTSDNNSVSSCVTICASFGMHLSWKVKGKLRRLQYSLQYLHFIFSFFFFHERFHVPKLSFCQFFIEHKKYPLTKAVSKWVKVVFNQCNAKQGEDTKSCRSRHVSQRELNIPQEMSLDFFLMELCIWSTDSNVSFV